MKAKLIATVSKNLKESEHAMQELAKDNWEINQEGLGNFATTEINIPCALKEGDCISFSTYWGDIESVSYNARLGLFEYFISFDYESILEQ